MIIEEVGVRVMLIGINAANEVKEARKAANFPRLPVDALIGQIANIKGSGYGLPLRCRIQPIEGLSCTFIVMPAKFRHCLRGDFYDIEIKGNASSQLCL